MAPNIIFIVRLMITLTFLILVVFGPYAIWKLNRFIKVYLVRHQEVRDAIAAERVARLALEERVARLEEQGHAH